MLSHLPQTIGLTSKRRGVFGGSRSISSNSIEYSRSSFSTPLAGICRICDGSLSYRGLKSMRQSNGQRTRIHCHGNPERQKGTYSRVSNDSGYRVWHCYGVEGSSTSGEMGHESFIFSDLRRTIG
jgi:hypothetical protein